MIVTGSIASDFLMTFPGRFVDRLVTDKLDQISLSFLVDDLEIRHGGSAANIAFGLGQLGLRPVLVGAVGGDFAEYRAWLQAHGVDTDAVLVSENAHTARFLCTTDNDHNQIASFYPGAMVEARTIQLAPIVRRTNGVDLVVIAPNDPEAMLRHTHECLDTGLAFAADPSQQLARMDGEQVQALVAGAAWLFTNEYERELLLDSTKWTVDDVLARVGTWVTTLGGKGVQIEARGAVPLVVRAVPLAAATEPTGAGDAFRAGFIAGIGCGLDAELAAQLGCVTASFAMESSGPQSYRIALTALLSRLGATYGRGSEIALAVRVQKVEFPSR